jgi:hypothetical protein
MSIEQALLEKLRALPPDKQQELLAFAESLQQQAIGPAQVAPGPRESLLGLWDDLGIDITAEEIDELRREMWTMSPPGVKGQQEPAPYAELQSKPSHASDAEPPRARRTIQELQIDTDVDISEEEIADARREMWGNFPCDDIS